MKRDLVRVETGSFVGDQKFIKSLRSPKGPYSRTPTKRSFRSLEGRSVEDTVQGPRSGEVRRTTTDSVVIKVVQLSVRDVMSEGRLSLGPWNPVRGTVGTLAS